MAETIYKIGNKILKIGGKLLTVHEDAPSFLELVNLGSTEYKRTTQGTTVEYFDLTQGTSYPYMAISCDVDLYYERSSDAENFMLGNADASDNRWRMRAYFSKTLVGFVGIRSGKGVTGWTTETGQSVGSMTLDGVTYRTTDSWTRTSGYRSVKLVYDVANFKCYVYIEGTLYGYATVDYSPYTITRVSVQEEQSYGPSNYAAFKNFKIGAFQNLEDAIAY